MFTDDFILNGEGVGEVGEVLNGVRYDAGYMRPYREKDGQLYVTINNGMKADKDGNLVPNQVVRRVRDLGDAAMTVPVTNATLALRKDEWIRLDQVVVQAALQRMRAWSDLRAANTLGGFDGMASPILEHETESDPGEAVQDMDGLTEGRSDAPKYQLEGLPLPITHSDFWFSARQMAVSRTRGTPLETNMAAKAGRRVGEKLEKMTIGYETGMLYGNTAAYGRAPRIYGYLNHPDRITKTDMTIPDGTNNDDILTDWLTLRESLFTNRFYGPYIAYTSSDYDQFLDTDFKANGDMTLRERLEKIDGISAIRRLDFLDPALSGVEPYTVILVQMTPDVARAVNGMELTTLQWPSHGGQRLNFKVMTIQVPQIRADYYGRTGVAVGTTA